MPDEAPLALMAQVQASLAPATPSLFGKPGSSLFILQHPEPAAPPPVLSSPPVDLIPTQPAALLPIEPEAAIIDKIENMHRYRYQVTDEDLAKAIESVH